MSIVSPYSYEVVKSDVDSSQDLCRMRPVRDDQQSWLEVLLSDLVGQGACGARNRLFSHLLCRFRAIFGLETPEKSGEIMENRRETRLASSVRPAGWHRCTLHDLIKTLSL